MSNNYSEYAEQCLDNIFDALDKFHCGQVFVLTGENGTGKSLIRKVLHQQLKKTEGENVKVSALSMDLRAGLGDGTGSRAFIADCDWTCTSENSLGNLKSILNSSKDRFIVLDEPEVGMSESLQMSIGHWLSNRLQEVMTQNKGVLIITHSKALVKNLSIEHVFVNMQGKDENTWLNEKPQLIDLDEYQAKNDALFRLLREHLK